MTNTFVEFVFSNMYDNSRSIPNKLTVIYLFEQQFSVMLYCLWALISSLALVKSEGLVGTNWCITKDVFKELCFCVCSSGPTRSSTPCFPYLMRTWVGTWMTTFASFVTDPKFARAIQIFTSRTSCTVSVIIITAAPVFFQLIIS